MSSSLMATLCNFRSIVSLLFSGFVVSSSIQAPPVPAHKIRAFWSIKTACTLPRACRHLCIGVVILNGVGDKGDIHTITDSEIFSERATTRMLRTFSYFVRATRFQLSFISLAARHCSRITGFFSIVY